MRLSLPSIAGIAAATFGLAGFSPALIAQNSIELFAPVNARQSAAGTGYGAATVNFNSTTLHLTCPASPIVAKLSSTPDNAGKLLVDNDIAVTVTSGETTTGPTNICVGGANNSAIGIPFQNCFTLALENAPASSVLGQDPDNLVALYGVPAIDISNKLLPGDLQVKIDLQDEGGNLANSTLYLNTNCTQTGVTGPALISGNPIPTNNPTPDQLSQDFSFNPLTGQQIGFEYDLTAAQAAGSVNIADQTIPQVGDMPLDPAIFQSQYTPGTSFATSACLVHSGEVLANGQPACKIYTLECKIGTGADATGAQCPVSSVPNEIFQDVFDGPAFTLPDIPTPHGPTFHEGIGLIMAKEGWTGGPCAFDPAANLTDLDCPQNLLTSFTSSALTPQSLKGTQSLAKLAKAAPALGGARLSSGPRALATSTSTAGTYTSSGRTTHPNSTFISIAGVPEPLTTVTIQGAFHGQYSPDSGGTFDMYWVKGDPIVSFSTQPPNLAGVNISGAANFVPSPISSVNYELGNYGFPTTDFPSISPSDPTAYPFTKTVDNSQGCPAPSNPTSPAATVFNPAKQTISGYSEGTYLLYYYAQDCAGTEELRYTQDNAGGWSSSFYAVPVGIDNTAPVIHADISGVSGPGSLPLGAAVSIPFTCTDALSGIATCAVNGNDYGPGNDVFQVDTSSPGTRTILFSSTDHAGNKATFPVQYSVQTPAQTNSVQLSLSTTTFVYPGAATATVKVGPSSQNPPGAPVGTAQVILDGQTLLGQGTLSPSGHGFSSAYVYISGLSAGHHTLTGVNPGGIPNVDFGQPGTSAPVSITVQPAPVTLQVSCVNPGLPFGASFSCNVYTKPVAAGTPGVITYKYDNGAAISVPLSGGAASFTISKPTVGAHSVTVSYAAQGNYAAATPQTKSFTVAPNH